MEADKRNRKEDSNAVMLCGRFVNRWETRDVVMITISVMEVVNAHDKEAPDRMTRQIYYPKVYFFKEDGTAIREFFAGDEVMVKAHIAAPRKKRRNGEVYYSQALVGDEIRERRPLYPDFPSGAKEPQCNQIYVKGPVLGIEKKDNGRLRVRIQVMDHGHIQAITLLSRDERLLLLPSGTEIEAFGKITTRAVFEEGKRPRHYQNMIMTRWNQPGKEEDPDEKE